MNGCSCWARKLPVEETFSLRNGAHNPTCPVYRPSMDPVDNYHDAEIRMREEMEISNDLADRLDHILGPPETA